MRSSLKHFPLTHKYILLSFFACYAVGAFAQDVMLQGWVWNYPLNYGFKRYAQNYLGYVPDLQEAGFNYIWLPPMSRASIPRSGMGYDIQDYYDLGEYGLGTTRFGTRKDVNNLIAALKAAGIHPVADMVYNQRVGGQWEQNDVVKDWITGYNTGSINAGNNVYPSDRFRCIIPVGGNSGNGPGNYYFKIRSGSQNSKFYGYRYNFQVSTTKVPIALDSLNNSWEYEPNNGGGCGDTGNFYIMGSLKYANIDNGGCGVDEFRLALDTSMYNITGDTLIISMINDGTSGLSGFADQELMDVFSGPLSKSIGDQIVYQTQTDFTHLPSGRGGMNWSNFKPNGRPTNLGGDWDEMLFFYDVDQYQPSTIKTFSDFQEWMFDSVGIEGMRVDAVKNMTTDFPAEMIDSLHFHGHDPKMVVGEYYDGNPAALINFVNTVEGRRAAGNNINMKLFDFALRFPLQDACNLNIDVRNVFHSGMVNAGGGKRENAVTWINNHDFRDAGQYVSNNPELAYAYMITNSLIGTPCVFQGDYFANNTLRGKIKGLIHASKRYTMDADKVKYLDDYNSPFASYITGGFLSNTLIYQFHNPVTKRVAVVAINFSHNTLNLYQQIDTSYGVAVGDTFSDVFGVGVEKTTVVTANRELHVVIPARSFTMYVQGGDLADTLVSLTDTVTAKDPNGIEPVTENGNGIINIFPNPFNNIVHIAVEEVKADNLLIDMYDLSGRQLYEAKFENPVNGVVTFIPPVTTAGIYLLKVTADDGGHFYKLVRN